MLRLASEYPPALFPFILMQRIFAIYILIDSTYPLGNKLFGKKGL